MKRTTPDQLHLYNEEGFIDIEGEIRGEIKRVKTFIGIDLASGKDQSATTKIRGQHPEMAHDDYGQRSNRTFIGIDNGVTGGVTIISMDGSIIVHSITPVHRCLNYTKKKAFANRVDSLAFKDLMAQAGSNTFVMIERPMINPGRFTATISAIRCLEATELILEELKIPYQFIDSKEWQKALLPSGLKGNDLKTASLSVASRLYPRLKIVNSDCLLIALYCKNKMS